MKTFSCIVGVDVAKRTLAVCIGGEKPFEVNNDAAGLSRLLKVLGAHTADPAQILVACEHTGNYLDKLSLVITGAGITLWAIHPQVMHSYQPTLQRSKSDMADARRIYSYAATHPHLTIPYQRPEPAISHLRYLVRARKQIVNIRKQVLTQLAELNTLACPPTQVCTRMQVTIKQHTGMIHELDREIVAHIRSSVLLKRPYQILKSLPGIGPVIAAHLLAQTDALRRFATAKQLACYLGLVPFERTSGSSIRFRPRTSKKAYQPLKAELHQGAISVIRKGLFFHEYYQRMKQAGKHHLWILNAIAHTLVRLAFTLVKNDTLFDAHHYRCRKKSWLALTLS